MTRELGAADLDLKGIIRPGDRVFWGQAAAEPLTLSAAIVAQRAELGPLEIFLGLGYAGTLRPEHADHLRFIGYGALGDHQALAKAGLLQILPCHYSQLSRLLRRRELRCDVACLHLSPPNADGECSLGAGNDYMLEAARQARVVIAEINDQAPWTYGSQALADLRIDYLVRTSRLLPEVTVPPPGEIEQRIGRHAASFVEDGAVLQTGIGSIPDAVLAALAGHHELGAHTGLMGDGMLALIEAGVITNARKPIDAGITISGLLAGSSRLYRCAHENAALHLCPSWYTHDAGVLARFDNLVAINSALEVDLTGQVNAEVGNGIYLGAVGGQLDFVRAANAGERGCSIIALPSTAKDGAISRIVARNAGITTTPRSDADLVVTEWGAARLRGRTIPQRVRAMIAIADPAFREQLERDAHRLVRMSA
ncbi:MAG: acetyl-CoA hydrolase/transferase family protein [Burkholderiales bacterium]|nr:acetyl-CoA hydrolase/transferase family protein [Burkholderiales bacterium]OJX08394.1 MAG: acetyl-CoA hydrolase [Burkholderiales bacterium 70-64]